MANTMEMAERFQPIVDELYKENSKTDGMSAGQMVEFSGVNKVKVMKADTTGMGDYDRADGYPSGNITIGWEEFELTEERGIEFQMDRQDNEETLNMGFATATGNFMKNYAVPEIDAFRFARYASATGIGTKSEELTSATITKAIDEAKKFMDAAEVPQEGRHLFITSDAQPLLSSAVTRSWGSDGSVSNILTGYNGMKIEYIVPNRFYDKITLNTGASSWGYGKGAGASELNFMMIHPSSILQYVKMSKIKIFDPDIVQKLDSWLFQFRLYHDAFVYANKAKGVYASKKPLPETP